MSTPLRPVNGDRFSQPLKVSPLGDVSGQSRPRVGTAAVPVADSEVMTAESQLNVFEAAWFDTETSTIVAIDLYQHNCMYSYIPVSAQLFRNLMFLRLDSLHWLRGMDNEDLM